MNSSEEVQDVGNLAVEHGGCFQFQVATGGSTNADVFTTFAFDQYIPSSSPGKLIDIFTNANNYRQHCHTAP